MVGWFEEAEPTLKLNIPIITSYTLLLPRSMMMNQKFREWRKVGRKIQYTVYCWKFPSFLFQWKLHDLDNQTY